MHSRARNLRLKLSVKMRLQRLKLRRGQSLNESMTYMPYIMVGLLLTAFGEQALAKTVCVSDGDNQYVFNNVKALKKPGQVSPLDGFVVGGGSIYPINGTALVRADRSILVGISQYANLDGAFRTIGVSGTSLNNATGTIVDMAFGSGVNTGPITWTPFDCKNITLP